MVTIDLEEQFVAVRSLRPLISNLYDIIGKVISDRPRRAVYAIRISGRSCMNFYTKYTKISLMRCVQCETRGSYLSVLKLWVYIFF